jgi:hypothetical protein
MGPLGRELALSRAIFYISLEPAFICLSKSPVNEHPSRFPTNRAPMERDISFQSLPLLNLLGLQESTPPPLQVHLTDRPKRQMLHFQSSLSSVSQQSPVNEIPSFPTGPLWRELPISRAFIFVSLGFPSKSSPDRKISLSLKFPGEGASLLGSPAREPFLQVPLT